MPTDAESLYGTACWTAAARAKETARSDGLFDDPYAATLAGVVGLRALEASELSRRSRCLATDGLDDEAYPVLA